MQISPEGDDRRKVSYYANGNIQISLEGDDHRKISLISWPVNETGNMICQSNVAMQLGTSYCYLRHVFSSVLIGKRYCIILYFQISCCIGRFMFTNFLSASFSFCYTTGVVYLRGLVKSSRVGTKGGLNLSQDLLKSMETLSLF